MKARTVKEYVDKIKSMEDAQKNLTYLMNQAKESLELSSEIKKSQRELENLTKNKT